ncbi:MAG: XRE family transcriptional regulator [Rhodospirillales bacterium]|nr:XRE family transcriptional regulator [Rhodospirillales bacterium]
MDDARFTGKLCKAARALAGWNQAELAKHANVAKQTVADFERGARTPFPNNLTAIQNALGAAGVVVTADPHGVGVRIAPSPSAITTPAGSSAAEREAEQIFQRYAMPEDARQDFLALLATTRKKK